eukprot:1781768-Prymnesium_polylepis.1
MQPDVALHLRRVRRPGRHYSAGYNHMCRFFAVQWMWVLRYFEVAFRVDEDIIMTSLPREPLTRVMADR